MISQKLVLWGFFGIVLVFSGLIISKFNERRDNHIFMLDNCKKTDLVVYVRKQGITSIYNCE